jgi:light-regulated signal transduction histidine kinase (bacteriophytochrome)
VWGLLAVSLVRTASGYPDYFVGQVTDITRQKMAEEALAQHAGELERSNTALQEFASLASHDLQEPLRVISAYVQLVTQHFGGILDEDGRRWLTYIVSGATRMHRLINDILALARVQAAGTPFTAVDVAQTVAAEWAELESMHPRLDATLTIETLPTVQADRAQMKVLFRNLLTNAFKYRRAAIPLTIHVSGARTAAVYGSESVWQFAVADNGIGLDMAHACDVFESFHRLHRDDEYEGTGIGLAICRRIVERHGGRIWVESAPDQGATFRFTLGEQAPHWR